MLSGLFWRLAALAATLSARAASATRVGVVASHDDTDPSHAVQLISIDDEGKLVLNQELKTLISGQGQQGSSTEVVHPIVLFGKFKTGKSTLATMLSCNLADAPMHFPASAYSHNPLDMQHTRGMWMGRKFKHGGKTFIIFDMEGLESMLVDKDRKHALLKIIALFTEVASVFLQTTGLKADAKDLEILGMGLKQTREQLITIGDIEKSEVPVARSINHPALIVVKSVGESALSSDATAESKQVFDAMGRLDQHFPKLLVDNFDNYMDIPVEVDGQVYGLPWMFHYLPHLTQHWRWSRQWKGQMLGKKMFDDTYNWQQQKPFEHGEGCGYLDNMTASEWAGTTVPIYKEKLDTLGDRILERAVERRVAWGGDSGRPLVGKMLWDFLEVGVEQMNKIGPLPESEMWRLIMGDGCEKKCQEVAEEKLGSKEGALADIANLVDKAAHLDADVLDEIDQTWRSSHQEVLELLEGMYHTDFAAVQESCKEATDKHIRLLSQAKERLRVQAKLKRTEADLKTKQAELEKKQAELDNKHWQENKMWYSIWAASGSVGALALVRLFR